MELEFVRSVAVIIEYFSVSTSLFELSNDGKGFDAIGVVKGSVAVFVLHVNIRVARKDGFDNRKVFGENGDLKRADEREAKVSASIEERFDDFSLAFLAGVNDGGAAVEHEGVDVSAALNE